MIRERELRFTTNENRSDTIYVPISDDKTLPSTNTLNVPKMFRRNIDILQFGNPSGPDKTTFFKFCWWNGGGKIKLRLNTNPVLRKFLAQKPDIFVYGEAGTPSSLGLSINGYASYLHKSKLKTVGNYRRGLAIFYLTKYRFLLTKVYSSKTYDIVWFRLNSPFKPLFFCFFYSPGAHHPLSIRNKFYDIFSSQYSRFAPLGKIYMLGDTNARLGHMLDDRNLHGDFITNSNQPLLLEFLQYSGLIILNSKFCKGTPTYEIVNKKRSIIDLGLTNSIESVHNFEIERTPFGVNSQTCHRALTMTISIAPSQRTPIKAPRRSKCLNMTVKELRRLGETVSNRLLTSERTTSPDYFLLAKTFAQVKKKLLDRSRNKPNPTPTSPATQTLQRRFSDAIARMQQDKSDFSFFVVDNLEKLLNTQYVLEEERRTSEWIQKLNDLDFSQKLALFSQNSEKGTMLLREPDQ